MDIVLFFVLLTISIGVILLMLYIASHHFFKRIYLPYKNQLINLDFESSLLVLKTIINTELDAYENDIFSNKGSITNSNFDNFYKDITNKIIRSVSPELIRFLSHYITEDMVYIIIARSVKKFLSEKINGTL